MAKPNPLMQGLEHQQPARAAKPAARPAETTPAERPTARKKPKSRIGHVLIGGHFAPEVQTALKIIAAEERTTLQNLVAEGLNTVFARRHKPEIAGLPADE